MGNFKTAVAAGIVGLVASVVTANASPLSGTFSVTVFSGDTGGVGFSTGPGTNPFSAPVAAATFTYTGALNFNNSAAQNIGNAGDLNSSFFASAGNAGPTYGISNYAPINVPPITGTANPPSNANFSTLANFLASSGSGANYAYGSFYTIDLGVLAAGTVLTITHDDGASVYQGSTQVGTTVSGPTGVVTDQVKLLATGDTTLYYSRQNGTPSILQTDVPEPASLVLLGAGLTGLGLFGRRRNRAA